MSDTEEFYECFWCGDYVYGDEVHECDGNDTSNVPDGDGVPS